MKKHCLLMLLLTAPGVLAAELPEKAICRVCSVHGETKPEKVAASAVHEGVTYYFCATDCRDAFVADPAAYVPQPLPRPAPAWAAYRVKTVPAMFLVDRKGSIVAQWTGEVDGDVVAREVECVVGAE